MRPASTGLLDRPPDFDTARRFAPGVVDLLAARHSYRLTTEARKNKRRGRLYLDTRRNAYAEIPVAPYAVRARPHARSPPPVLGGTRRPGAGPPAPDPAHPPRSLDRHGNPWKGLCRCRRSVVRARRRLDDQE
ncbi:hypothetical protein ACIRBZ_33235 [Streptomyces sp. NPDC094038]|uniref:non-homologous end-joining DNA ligase LigD n=1 Tax=Streptomyces sp. NPDC094038 TaxID=3366055 RepID=UPI00381BED35